VKDVGKGVKVQKGRRCEEDEHEEHDFAWVVFNSALDGNRIG
jgi:hypothetical protein